MTQKIAQLIQWGYETSGDFDEALRLLKEIDGIEIDNPAELETARKQFDQEFQTWN